MESRHSHIHTLTGKLASIACAAVILAGMGGGSRVYADGPEHQHPSAKSATTNGNKHGGHEHAHGTVPAKVLISMRDGGYHVTMGGQPRTAEFSLVAGLDTMVTLRNEDRVPHELISPLFTRTDVAFSGSAVGIFKKEAAGFRLYPGKTLILHFKVPYTDFQTMYDVFWCNLHGEQHGAPNHQEFLVVATRELT